MSKVRSSLGVDKSIGRAFEMVEFSSIHAFLRRNELIIEEKSQNSLLFTI